MNNDPNLDVAINGFPKLIANWGILTLTCVFVLIIYFCNTISYPKLLKTDIIINNFSKKSMQPDNAFKIESKFYGKIQMNANEQSKIKVGMPVSIEIDEYPNAVFGSLKGEVGMIRLNKQKSYDVLIWLPNKLITSNNRNIELRDGYKGKVEIIVNESSLLKEIFNPLFSYF